MQAPTVCRVVVYREGDQQHPAIVTSVREDGRINLAVFSADGHCYGRSGILAGDGPGQWSWPPRVGAPASAELSVKLSETDASKFEELRTLVQNEMKTLDELTDSVRAAMAKQQEKVDALEKQVADLSAQLAAAHAPSSPPATPTVQ